MSNEHGSEDSHYWAEARTLTDIGQLTAQWLEGTITHNPGYGGPGGPDDETLALAPGLAIINRAGLVTDFSQPGERVFSGFQGKEPVRRSGSRWPS
jgi:hypothetical protein